MALSALIPPPTCIPPIVTIQQSKKTLKSKLEFEKKKNYKEKGKDMTSMIMRQIFMSTHISLQFGKMDIDEMNVEGTEKSKIHKFEEDKLLKQNYALIPC